MPKIFITGGRRTGTTLVENIVCSYDGTNPAISEAQLITQLMQTLKWASDPEVFNDYIKHTFPRREDLLGYYEEMLSSYAARTRQAHQCSGAVVFKNPEYCKVIDELVAVAPTARFIVCVRDPRDQVVSELEVIERRKSMWGVSAGRNIGALARGFNAYYERVFALADIHPEKFLFVRYEDVVQRFSETLARLDAFTGLTGNCFNPQGHWPRNLEQGLEVPDYPTFSPLYGKPLDTSSIGRFATALTPAETRRIEAYCAGLMQRFDYVPTQPPAAATPSSPSAVEIEAVEFLASSTVSVDMSPGELKALLQRTNALKADPDCGDDMCMKLETFRRAARGALDWVELRKELPGR